MPESRMLAIKKPKMQVLMPQTVEVEKLNTLVILWQNIWWNDYYGILEGRPLIVAPALEEIIGKIQDVVLCLLLLAALAESTKKVNSVESSSIW